jgi:CelD/BcsL family acetyltransferase involved in cellulose biosynthesis
MKVRTTLRAPAATDATPADGWSVETLRDDDALTSLRAEWNDLFERCPTATPFQSYAWLRSWWGVYGVPGRLRLVLVRRGARLVAAAPLMLVRRWGCSVLTPLGGDLSDFTDVLVDEAVAAEAAKVLADALLAQPDWQVIDFPETRQGAVVGRHLLAGWAGVHWEMPASLCLELAASPMEELVRNLPTHARKTVRRRLNQIDRLDIRLRVVPVDETGRAVVDLLRLHALQWHTRGVNPQHLRPEFARHLTQTVRDMTEAGQAALLEYRTSERLIASSLVIIGHDFTGGYLYGAHPDLQDRIDITTMLVTTTVELAHRHGCSTMSMLRGAEAHKMRWRPREAVNQRLLLAHSGSLRTLAFASGARTLNHTKRKAKQRLPWLRSVRDRARRAGAWRRARRE